MEPKSYFGTEHKYAGWENSQYWINLHTSLVLILSTPKNEKEGK